MPLFRDGECPELRRWSEFSQIIWFAVCALVANYLLSLIIFPFQFTDTLDYQTNLVDNFGVIGAFFMMIGRPIYETLIGQWLPLTVARLTKKRPLIQLIWASVWFSILHLPNGPAHVIQSIGVGWVLASCFLYSRKESWFKAYRVTTISHALHNAVVFLVFLFFRSA